MFFDALRGLVVACALSVAMAAGTPAVANSPLVAVELSEVQHGDTTLTLVSPDGSETTLGVAAIEALPTYRVETTTPWREVPALFEGVRLRDLLAEFGLQDAAEILVTAENDYTAVVPRAVWETEPILVATRVNGAPISRRERGPILFVIEANAYEKSSVAREAHLVWMAARIESNG